MVNERYYYSIMSAEERKIYKTIYYALKAKSLNVLVEADTAPETIQDIYMMVLFDNPLFYYINQRIIKMSYTPGRYILMPEYLYKPKEIELIDKDIRRKVTEICDNARRVATNDFRLEKYLHDSVVKSVAYDYDALKKNDCFNAHSIIGAFFDRKAVCEGIAKAFKLLCNECMIKCIVVLGKADPEGVFGEDSYHAWNLVKIGNDSYHVDPTWDNMYDKGFEHISYDYFNLTTKYIMKDHRPMGVLPECNSTRLNYFSATGSFVSTYNELESLVAKRIDQKAIMFRYLRDKGEFLTEDEIREKVVMAVSEAMRSGNDNRKCALLINKTHQTGKILFTKYKIELGK